MEDDLRLIEEYLNGSEAAAEELVVRYQRRIYAFVYRMINDMEETKDLTQKTFLNALSGIRNFRKESSFKTWLYQIAHNICINHIKQNRRPQVELDESIADGDRGVLAGLIDKERIGHVRKALNHLPERQKLAVILRVYEGLSCRETASVMRCSEGAVKAHYHLGVRRLRGILQEAGHEINA